MNQQSLDRNTEQLLSEPIAKKEESAEIIMSYSEILSCDNSFILNCDIDLIEAESSKH
jgi:hypothetical protein